MANLPFATIDSDSRAFGKPSMSQPDRDFKLRKARHVFERRQIGPSEETAWWSQMESNSRPVGAFAQTLMCSPAARGQPRYRTKPLRLHLPPVRPSPGSKHQLDAFCHRRIVLDEKETHGSLLPKLDYDPLRFDKLRERIDSAKKEL